MESFWTFETVSLLVAMALSLVAMIVLPIKFKIVDEQLGYFFLLIGGVMLALAFALGTVMFKDGSFVQHLMHGHKEGLHSIVTEPWMLILFYFVLSLLAIVFRQRIERRVRGWAERVSPPVLIAIMVLTVGALGSVSVVVMATVGGIFFRTLQKVTKKDYTPSVICFSAAIGISALLTTVGEPLSLFIARNLGEGTGYLLRTYGGIVTINVVLLAGMAWWFAARAKSLPETVEQKMVREVHEAEAELAKAGDGKEVREALAAVEEFEEEHHDFAHHLDQLLHSTSKLFFFVIGLMLYGEAVKPVAAHIFGNMHPIAAFFGNSISAVADNALLGLLEVQAGMAQSVVFVLGLSLAFWGVGLVPGNVCNIVLKEKLGISFGAWARYGIPVALVLAAVNFVFVLLGAGQWLTF